eukprot:scaffold289399_cov17-Tisochrysis_lutea.AAC.1
MPMGVGSANKQTTAYRIVQGLKGAGNKSAGTKSMLVVSASFVSKWFSNESTSCLLFHRGCRELGANGTKSMLAVPVSFVSEHIE